MELALKGTDLVAEDDQVRTSLSTSWRQHKTNERQGTAQREVDKREDHLPM